MKFSDKTGSMSSNASKTYIMDNGGLVLAGKGSKNVYYGHHMLDVSTHPEYAGDWRNIQALDYQEHYYGAHGSYDTKTPTEGFYDVATGKAKKFDADAEGFSFEKINNDYPPKSKCVLKSDAEMSKAYDCFNKLNKVCC